MQSWDGWLHVNPLRYQPAGATQQQQHEVGLAMLFNPTAQPIETTIALPIYYTGVEGNVWVSVNDNPAQQTSVTRDYFVMIKIALSPMNVSFVVLYDHAV